MKVAMLGWELPPHNSGGLGVACYQLCKALAHSGVAIDFFLPYQYEHDIDFIQIRSAVPVHIKDSLFADTAYDSADYGLLGTGHDLSKYERLYIENAKNMIASGHYDIIHAHDWLTLQAGVAAKEYVNKPLIAHVHSVEADRAGRQFGGNPYVREIESLGLHRADAIIAVSEHTKQAIIREYRIPADKITVIHNSVDHQSFDLAPSAEETSYQYLKLMKEQGYRVVMNVGRLTIQKGLDYLLAAAAQVVRYAPKTLFVFVGSGEQRDELIMKAAEQGIADRVFFAGFQRGKRWRDAYKIADLFVMPSVSEPFGLTPLEAIGYGTPVLLSKQSGVSEVLKNVLTVDFWDTDKMAEYITAVVRSDALRGELYTNARRELSNLSWHKQVPHFIELYHKTKLLEATG